MDHFRQCTDHFTGINDNEPVTVLLRMSGPEAFLVAPGTPDPSEQHDRRALFFLVLAKSEEGTC